MILGRLKAGSAKSNVRAGPFPIPKSIKALSTGTSIRVEKYITAYAGDTESGKSEFNLGTYWPKLSPDYLKEIELTTEISKDTPKGIYVVGVDMGAPSREYQQEQSLKYLLSYTDPNIGMYRGPSEFRLFIEVI
jgi:hypothetical protein